MNYYDAEGNVECKMEIKVPYGYEINSDFMQRYDEDYCGECLRLIGSEEYLIAAQDDLKPLFLFEDEQILEWVKEGRRLDMYVDSVEECYPVSTFQIDIHEIAPSSNIDNGHIWGYMQGSHENLGKLQSFVKMCCSGEDVVFNFTKSGASVIATPNGNSDLAITLRCNAIASYLDAHGHATGKYENCLSGQPIGLCFRLINEASDN